VQTIKAGAEDFLTKPVPKARLLTAVEGALARCTKIRDQDNRTAALRSSLAQLTPRENEVLTLLVRGKPHKQIAYELGASERTIKMHRRNILEKFSVRSWAELAVMAERLGLLSAVDRGNKKELSRPVK
jgi:FixJ family two-component response regulator